MKVVAAILTMLICYGSSVYAQIAIHLSKGCTSDGQVIGSESYPSTFDPSNEARKMVDHIMEVAGVPANFELRFAAIKHVVATTDQGQRYLLYSNDFLKKLDRRITYWGAYFLLAHEIGHHLKRHDFDETDPYRIKYNELEADVFAGSALRALGATLEEAKEAFEYLPMQKKTDARPAKPSRLEAMILGWNRHDRKMSLEEPYDLDYPAAITFHQLAKVSPANIGIQKLQLSRETEAKLKEQERQKSNVKISGAFGKPGNQGVGSETGANPFGKSNGTGGGPGGGIGTVNQARPTLYASSSNYENMPHFPWPPPNCYQRKTLVKNLSTKAHDLRDIDDRLQRALDAEGYFQRSYYQTPGGFALVTQMEQFEEDGSIKKRFRWTNYPVQDDFSNVWEYFKSLVMPTPGRFRVFAFVVTDQVYPRSEKRITPQGVQNLASGGFSQMSASYSKTEVTSSHYLEVLIYEFEAPQSTKKCMEKCPAFLDVQTHLLQSGLSNVIGF